MAKKIKRNQVIVCPACFALVANDYAKYHETWHKHSNEVAQTLYIQSRPHPITVNNKPTIGK